jgi:hypothetical protein
MKKMNWFNFTQNKKVPLRYINGTMSFGAKTSVPAFIVGYLCFHYVVKKTTMDHSIASVS